MRKIYVFYICIMIIAFSCNNKNNMPISNTKEVVVNLTETQKLPEWAIRIFPSFDGLTTITVNEAGYEDLGLIPGVKYLDGKEEKFINYENIIGVEKIEWLHNGRYLLIDSGTDVVRGYTYFDLQKAEVIGSISRWSDEYVIVNDAIIISTILDGSRSDGLVDCAGVCIYRIEQDSIYTEKIYSSTELEDYRVVGLINGNVNIEKSVYEKTSNESPYEKYKIVRKDLLEIKVDDIVKLGF